MGAGGSAVKILLDENLPHELRRLIAGHDVYTCRYMGWDGVQNGALLARASAAGFDALVTTDRGIEYEQNPGALAVGVLILHAKSNGIRHLRPLIPALLAALATSPARVVVRVG
ncbi:MAG: hypothetical protein JWO31_1325 [Phycisphaerales bacterium]|nr:hypothetical protein [Phycisphaerales bacterium]